MAGGIILQVDQAELKGEVIYRHQQERSIDPNMDCVMYLPNTDVHQIAVEGGQNDATNIEGIAA